MTAAPRKKYSKRPAQRARSVHLIKEDQDSLVSLAAKRAAPALNWIKGLAALLVALTIIGGGVAGFWTYFQLPFWVSNHQLTVTVDKVRGDIGKKINETKDEVVSLSNKNTGEVKEDVNGVKKVVETLAKKNEQATIAFLEGQARFLFTQKNNYVATLGSIDAQLRDKPGDFFLIQRKAETQSAVEYLDREMAATQATLRRLRGQE